MPVLEDRLRTPDTQGTIDAVVVPENASGCNARTLVLNITAAQKCTDARDCLARKLLRHAQASA